MKESKHDFRFTLVLPKVTPEHWFLSVLFTGGRNKDSSYLTYGKAKKKQLFGCYKGYVTYLSNGDRLVNLYYVTQDNEEDKALDVVTEELSELGIGWVIFK